MLLDPSVTELIHLVNQAFKEITVVGDNNQRAIVCLQSLFENILGLDVHMVGRLIQCKHVVWLKHKLGHSKPCALAA